MKNEMEINEELVEEIGMEIFNYANDANPRTYQTAEDIITRILSAVEDGTLPLRKVPPKLPGEVGRGKIKYAKGLHELDAFDEMWDGELVVWDKPHSACPDYPFIALRKEKGGDV